jgi:hypothetical protein
MGKTKASTMILQTLLLSALAMFSFASQTHNGRRTEHSFSSSSGSYYYSSSSGSHCIAGTYLQQTRRFLHARPLAQVLQPDRSAAQDLSNLSLPTTALVSPTSTSWAAELPPVYFLSHSHDQRSVETFDRLKKMGLRPERHEFIPITNMHLHWEEVPAIAPAPKMPLYWINLGEGVRRTSMEKQINSLGWRAAKRVQAVSGGDQNKGGFDALASLVGPTNFRDMKCAVGQLRSCTLTEVATLLSHLSAIRQAYHGESILFIFSRPHFLSAPFLLLGSKSFSPLISSFYLYFCRLSL